MRIKTPLTEEELKKLYSFFKRYFDSSRIRNFPEKGEEYDEFFSFLVENEEIHSLFVEDEDEDEEDGFIHFLMKIGVEEYLKSLSKKR